MSKARANNIKPADDGIFKSPSSSDALLLTAPQVSSIQVMQSTSLHAAPPPVTRPANAGSESAASKTTTASNLLINVPLQVDSIATIECSNPRSLYHWLRFAEIAYSRRDLVALKQIAAHLLILPDSQAQSAGLYYLAIVAKRSGQERRAISLLESISNDSFIRARAIQTLGAIEFDAGRHEQALPLFIEAARQAKGIDVATSLNALFQVSSIKSIAGDHQQSLDDLLSLWPVVRSVVRTHPHLYFNWHNDCAVELLELGRVEQAREASAVALASPVSRNYQEYSETRDSIERYEQKKIIVTVRSLPKSVITFRLSFLASRRVLTSRRLRLPVIGHTILERIIACIRAHAPPLNVK